MSIISAHNKHDLTKKQSQVIETLAKAGRPLGAYTILDELRDDGFKAPLQVYRTLDQLISLGFVHRLESLNAYIVCQMETCGSTDNLNTSFIICDLCGLVQELPHTAVESAARILLDKLNFTPTKSTIEIRGLCHACQS
jgi:Fur family zinc uptake transcriptional regulator